MLRNLGGRSNAAAISPAHNYILIYSLLGENWKNVRNLLDRNDKSKSSYKNPDNDPKGPWRLGPIFASGERHEGLMYTITCPNGETIAPPKGSHWRMLEKDFWERVKSGSIVFGMDGKGAPATKLYLSEVQAGLVPRSIWLHDEAGHTQDGKREVMSLFPEANVFDTPKPTKLLRLITKIACNESDIVMDFFSGSATTANAVMQLNAEDGGNRKFIMVQLPEQTEKESESYKSGFQNICEIGKERIRRAGKKILEEQKAKQGDLFSDDKKPLDVGFRVFKCADSNMKDVYYTPADYSQQLLLELEDNIKDDRNDLDLLFGCMLDWGVTLDLPMRTEKVDSVTIHIVNDGDLVACFDQNIPETAIDYIASLLPMRVVLRDSCFCEAKEKMNFFEIFKQRTGWSEEEVRKNVKVI